MATFYVGVRPVLRGRNSNDFSFAEKARTLSGVTRSAVGVYSNYSLFAPGVLTGGPDNNHTPGTGHHPHGIFLTRRYRGLDTLSPLDGPGAGERLDGFRYHPHEYKGLPGSQVLASVGHVPRDLYYGLYSNDTFDGVASAEQMTDPGHTRRSIGAAGTAATFGSFDPWVNKGVTTTPLSGTTQTYPTVYNNEYGRNRVNEWQGVPSSRAL